MDTEFTDAHLADSNSFGSETVLPTTPSTKKGRRPKRNLFGRADLADVYHRARDLIVEHGIFRMAQTTENDDGSSSIVICNLWRIDRASKGVIKTFEFDFGRRDWIEVETSALQHWPYIPLYPIQKTQSLDWWRDVAHSAIWIQFLSRMARDQHSGCLGTTVPAGLSSNTGGNAMAP